MGHYKSNLRDIEFNLFEVLGRDQLYGTGPFAEMDVETAKDILGELARLAENELAESFADADRNPPVFDPETNTAPVPDTFKKSYQAFMDSEYWRLGLPEEIGGTTAPRSLIWAYAELVLGSNPAVWMYSSGPAFAGILYEEGTEEQKKIAAIAVEKQWGSTMVLTEPDAGSDVGAGRTKAVEQDGRHLAHRGREALHHLGRARHVREHHPLRAGPPRGRRPRHQGPVALHGARSSTSTGRPASWASATASTPRTSSTRWA